MNIYLIDRNDKTDYDQYDSAVVIADSPERAIEIIKETYQNNKWAWGTHFDLSATEIKLNEELIVLESFNAG